MWREKREHPEASRKSRVRVESRVNQDARLVRVGNDLLVEFIATVGIGARDPYAEAMRIEIFDCTDEVPALVVEKR